MDNQINNLPKHVYIVARENDNRPCTFMGYTYDRTILRKFLKTRKSCIYRKVKTKEVYQYLTCDEEINDYGNDVCMTDDEFMYFEESLMEKLDNIFYHFEQLQIKLNMIKFTKKEYDDISKLLSLIKNIKMLHDMDGCTENLSMGDIINWNKCQKYFIKHVLD